MQALVRSTARQAGPITPGSGRSRRPSGPGPGRRGGGEMAIPTTNSVSSRPLRETQDALQKTFAQLSSARRITQASDDAAGLAISEKLRAADRSFQQAERNLSDGLSVTRTADGAIQEQSDITIR